MEELTLLEETLMLGKIKARGEGDDRGWDGWMASPTQWTWVWASSGSWWWTGKPGVLQSMGSQRVRHDWVTELKWTEDLQNKLFRSDEGGHICFSIDLTGKAIQSFILKHDVCCKFSFFFFFTGAHLSDWECFPYSLLKNVLIINGYWIFSNTFLHLLKWSRGFLF